MAFSENRDGAATTLPIQPVPVDTDVTYTYVGGRCVTGIMRDWRAGDSSRCGLCPRERCTARGRDHCLVAVASYVDPGLAATFSVAGRRWQNDAGTWVDADGHRNVAGT